MTGDAFRTLAEAIEDEVFPEVDLHLREGGHIDDRDQDWFTFLEDARPWLESFYKRFGCDLMRSPEGFFYLEPRGDRFGRRTLSAAEMLVGQALCLLRLDPATLQTTGRVDRTAVIQLLERLVGAERLGRALNPRRRRARTVEESEIRKDVDGALRTLVRLGFVELESEAILLRTPLMRFAEPVMLQPRPDRALAGLIGEGALPTDDEESDG
jgi:chromosome partition protein MukE